MSTPSTFPSAKPNTAGRAYRAALAVLVLGLILTALAVTIIQSYERRETAARFLGVTERMVSQVREHLQFFILLARSTASVPDDMQKSFDLPRWRRYVRRIDPDHKWPSLAGMGVAFAVMRGDKTAFEQRQQRSGQSAYRIWSRPSIDANDPSQHIALTLMAPATPTNDALIGFDFTSEPHRKEALARARDRAEPVLTAPVMLLNLTGQREPGVTLFAPFYQGSAESVIQRQANFAGAIVIGITIGDVMRAKLAEAGPGGIALRVIDEMAAAPVFVNATADELEAFPIRNTHILEAGGRVWRFDFASPSRFGGGLPYVRSMLTGLLGGLLSTLLAGLIYYLSALRERAELRAGEMTVELRTSQERFRLVAEAAGNGVWDQDFERGTEYLSPSLMSGLLGYREDEFSGRMLAFSELIHPEDRARWQDARQNHIENNAPYIVDYRVRRADGEWLWVRSRGLAEKDARGHLLRLAGSIEDISARKQAEHEAAYYREYLFSIIDQLPEPVAVKDADLVLRVVNRAYLNWMGKPLGELIGRRISEVFPGTDAIESELADRRLLETGESQERDITAHPHGSAEFRRIRVHKVLGRAPEGSALVIGIHYDVTELHNSEERYRHLTTMSSDWFWEQDAEFRFSYMSKGIARSGYDPSRWIGLCRWDMPIVWSAEQWAEHRAMLAAHQAFRDLEYQIAGEDGTFVWFQISGEPVFDPNGVFAGYRGTGHHITERKKAEAELRHHRDNLQEMVAERTAQLQSAKESAELAYQSKSEFLANMSHELRTPLHAILSFARLGNERIDVGGSKGADKVQRYFLRIIEAGERLISLVNDLLDLSKIEAGKMQFDFQPHDIAALVRASVAELEALAEECRVRLVMPPPDVVAPAQVDAMRINQVLCNVLANAIKFSPVGGEICVAIETATQHIGRRADDVAKTIPAWRVTVTDQGIGIPEDELELVFDKFVQSSKSKTGAGGTGLGLAICREIVVAHRGTISAHNDSKGGAVFEILLPR